ncbi:hypothetical protein PF005_g13124 [Phytophthora fragariae]|uniref:DDE-1 domain-containing protein n=1 Tax=Phytophthora fragariae TaxID=53985 RepID=A0A6A3XPG6_9STRA|nr:hypothetical protein PF005_g13124 [Phytophthora fragariae]KAE9224877.1 hypothetical protein PF002_g14565 [Phytophthora fragariae]
MSAYLQPMDGGTIAAFKVAFRGRQLRWVYEKIKRGDKIDKNAYKIDQLQVMQWSKEIWHDLQVDEWSKNVDTSYGDGVDVDEIIIRASQLNL